MVLDMTRYWLLMTSSAIFAVLTALAFNVFWPTQYKVFRYNLSVIADYDIFDNRYCRQVHIPHRIPMRQKHVSNGQPGLSNKLVEALCLRKRIRLPFWF